MSLRENHAAEIESIVGRYAQKRSAVLPLLYLAQDTYGYLTDEAIREVAAILDLPPTDVFEVVGFYTLLYDRPVGRWVVQVCDDVPCWFVGAKELVAAFEQTLGVKAGQTTADGMFTLECVKCVAACHQAPVVQANLDFHYTMSPEKVDAFLADLRRRAESGEPISISGRLAES